MSKLPNYFLIYGKIKKNRCFHNNKIQMFIDISLS